MSVIHLNDRLTEDSAEFANYKRSSESLIYFKSELERDSFSIDFTVGDRWAEYAGQGDTPQLYTIEGDTIEIQSKQSIIVETKEKIKMPHNLFGIIMPTGRLFLHSGIMCNTAKIEPEYEDHLFLLLFNSSNSKKAIKTGQKITTAIFFSTEETPETVKTIHRELINQNRPYTTKQKILDSARANFNINPYKFLFEIIKWVTIFVSGATFTLIIIEYFNL